MPYDRTIYFDNVRQALFDGKLSQQQVDGQEAILNAWEADREPLGEDQRWLAYELATTKHETASTMWPIEEYGKGSGQPYGEADPETGKRYYGRGFVQLTWRDNYEKMEPIVQAAYPGQSVDLVWKPEQALLPDFAAVIMFEGMARGSFRPPNKLANYFNASRDDPYNARDIINGDKTLKPDWAGGQTIGNLIKGYHGKFLAALKAAYIEPAPGPEPAPEPEPAPVKIKISIFAPAGVDIEIEQIES